MRARLLSGVALGAALLAGTPAPARAADPAAELQRQFGATVRPFLATFCVGCHGQDRPKGQLDLSAFTDLGSVTRRIRRWESVRQMLTSKEMPPGKAKQQPGDEARGQVIAWISAVRQHEASRTAGDPGPVLARRLTNSEYDYTVRDLTGVDMRPTREFPVDPANEAGFDNSGESLVMSPALLQKYLGAAQAVAEHVVLAPSGLVFAADPAMTDTDRDKYAVSRIVRFYQQQPTDLARYFHAAWRFANRTTLGKGPLTRAACAAEEKVSPGYLREVWTALAEPEDVGPLAKLQRMFQALPPGDDAARAGCERMRAYVTALREKLSPTFKNLKLKNISSGSQPFVLWKNAQQATHRTSFDRAVLYVAGQPRPEAISPQTIKALDRKSVV